MTHTLLPRRGRAAAWRAAAAVLLAGVLTGCMKLDMDLSVDGDTVDGRIIAAIDRDTAALFDMTPEDMFDSGTEDDDLATLDGVSIEQYEEGDWAGVQYVLSQVPLTELNDLGTDDDEFPTITYDDATGEYEFTLALDLTDWFAEDDDLDEAEMPGLNLDALRDQLDIQVAVTFPGDVTEHNGELSGTTVTWRPEPGERTQMRAVAHRQTAGAGSGPGEAPGEPGSGSGAGQGSGPSGNASTGTALLVALIALVVVAGGGVAAWLLLRRRGATPVDADGGAVAAAGEGTPSAGGEPGGGSGTGGAGATGPTGT